MKKPKYSIIVPVYNVAAYLKRTVDSVLKQTFADWELILVDDGSTDGSGEMADGFALADKRITVIHQQNEGVVSARLHGFQKSVAENILFLDGDDEIVPKALATIDSAWNEHPECGIVHFGWTRMIDGIEKDAHVSNFSGLISFSELVAKCKLDYFPIFSFCIGDKCYNRNIVNKTFQEVGSVRIKNSEDGLFALAAMLNAPEEHIYIRESLYRYTFREGSSLHKKNLSIVKDKTQFLLQMERIARKSKRLSDEFIDNMLAWFAYGSICVVINMLTERRVSSKEAGKLLQELNGSDAGFFDRAKNVFATSFKRRLMGKVMSRPGSVLMIYKFVGGGGVSNAFFSSNLAKERQVA